MTAPARVCISHPKRSAPYVCTRCARWQCEACAKPLTDAYESARTCSHCNGIVRRGEVSAGIETPGEALGRLISMEAAMTIAALALPALLMALGTFITYIAFVIYVGVLATYYFQCVEHVAASREGLPFSSNAADIYAIGKGVARAFIPLLLIVGPVLAASSLFAGSWLMMLLGLLIGAGLMPASLLAGVVTRSAINQLWPPVWIEIIARDVRAYASLLGWIYGSLLGWIVTIVFFDWLLNGSTLRWLLLPLLHNACAIAQAILFGRFLQQHGPNYGLSFKR